MSHIKELSHDFTRGVIFGAGLSVGIGAIVISSIAFAAGPTGGKFGAAIDLILANGNTWQSPGDGTVKNALALSGTSANNFLKIKNNNGCPSGQAINRIQADGTITCVSVVAQ